MSESVGIREAKAQFSRLVHRAERGDTITLTHRGRPVAKIVPISERDRDVGARIEELKKRGWIQDHGKAPVTLPKLVVERGLAQRYLREERDAG